MLSSALRFERENVTSFRSMRLGEILIARGKLDAAGVERALRLQRTAARTRKLLVTLGLCAQRDVCEALAAQLDLPMLDTGGYPEFPILEERMSARFLREARALPVAKTSASSRSRWRTPPTTTRSARSGW